MKIKRTGLKTKLYTYTFDEERQFVNDARALRSTGVTAEVFINNGLAFEYVCNRVIKTDQLNRINGGKDMRKAHNPNKSYGCDDCKYLKGKHCKLWAVKVDDPADSHCESHDLK